MNYLKMRKIAGVGLKVISRIYVAIVFLETIYDKNKETAKKINYCILHGLPGKIRGNDQIWVKKLKILYRFLLLSLKIEDMSPLEGIAYGKKLGNHCQRVFTRKFKLFSLLCSVITLI